MLLFAYITGSMTYELVPTMSYLKTSHEELESRKKLLYFSLTFILKLFISFFKMTVARKYHKDIEESVIKRWL